MPLLALINMNIMATWSDPGLRNSSPQSRECGVDVKFEHVFVCVDGLGLTKT